MILAGGKKFTKLDMSHAYQQVVLERESRAYLTINTHKGLYCYTRLPFGVASAPAIFQQTMEKVLQGLERMVVYMNDILVTGKTDEEYLRNRKVLKHLLERDLRLKKCQLMQRSVEYVGYLVDAGLQPLPDKVEAITRALIPQNVKELRSFLGLVGYNQQFIADMSTLTKSLNELLQQSRKWVWTPECESVFEALSNALTCDKLLKHYDPDLPLKMDCDASSVGLGAVISHVFPNREERPIAFASRTLSSSECNHRM